MSISHVSLLAVWYSSCCAYCRVAAVDALFIEFKSMTNCVLYILHVSEYLTLFNICSSHCWWRKIKQSSMSFTCMCLVDFLSSFLSIPTITQFNCVQHLVDERSAQAMVSSGYKEETVTEEDVNSTLLNMHPLTALHIAAHTHRTCGNSHCLAVVYAGIHFM